ncbi:hypothetical protein J2858_002566 [Neorhizobium galegae]|nr:hypothetical protein [Neorhizobium galegae]
MALHGTAFVLGLVLFVVSLPLAVKYAGHTPRHDIEFSRLSP